MEKAILFFWFTFLLLLACGSTALMAFSFTVMCASILLFVACDLAIYASVSIAKYCKYSKSKVQTICTLVFCIIASVISIIPAQFFLKMPLDEQAQMEIIQKYSSYEEISDNDSSSTGIEIKLENEDENSKTIVASQNNLAVKYCIDKDLKYNLVLFE